MSNLRQAAQQALEALENSKRTHYYCEDTWYSCPKHEEGCVNESEGDACNCGADEVNVRIESAITALRAALAEPEQEPVAWWNGRETVWFEHELLGTNPPIENPIPLYTSPTPRKENT